MIDGFEQTEFDVDHLRIHSVLHALQAFAAEARRRKAVKSLKRVARNPSH